MKRAFTLVELLVVIGIIGLLIGILLPVLSKVRQSGYTARCANTLRQFGTAWQMYAAAGQSRSVPCVCALDTRSSSVVMGRAGLSRSVSFKWLEASG